MTADFRSPRMENKRTFVSLPIQDTHTHAHTHKLTLCVKSFLTVEPGCALLMSYFHSEFPSPIHCRTPRSHEASRVSLWIFPLTSHSHILAELKWPGETCHGSTALKYPHLKRETFLKCNNISARLGHLRLF